jgi:hypothetical protein
METEEDNERALIYEAIAHYEPKKEPVLSKEEQDALIAEERARYEPNLLV